MVVSHPGVGGALEDLLRLERRYEVRRVTRLAEAIRLAASWPPDGLLIDAGLVPRDEQVALRAPALVLAASDSESATAARSLDDPRGWVATDAPAGELVLSVERLLTNRVEAPAGSAAVALVGLLVVVFAALLWDLAWIAIT